MGSAELINGFAETVTLQRNNPGLQSVDINISADLLPGQSVSMKVNGTDVGPVVFTVDHATTWGLLISAVAAANDINGVSSADSHSMTLVSAKPGNTIIIRDMLVTGGDPLPVLSISNRQGGYVDGVWQDIPLLSIPIQMSVQPLQDKELLHLSEGDRTRRWLKGYTAIELFTEDVASGTPADNIVYNDTLFEVVQVERWRSSIAHYKVRLGEILQ